MIEEPHNCKAVRTGRSFVVNDVQVELLCPSKFVLPTEGSYFCGPLIAGGIIIGSVRIEAAKDLWTAERRRLLESYLSGAASALSNLRLLAIKEQQANIDMLTGTLHAAVSGGLRPQGSLPSPGGASSPWE